MLVKQFPDIHWLKSKIKQNFGDRRALNDVVLKHSGWPTIILNTKTSFAERSDIKGPFSIFLNRCGSSSIGLDGKTFKVNDQCFSTSNLGQHYDLLINERQATETLNIHFGEHFYFETLKALKFSDEKLLGDQAISENFPLNLVPRTSFRSVEFNQLVEEVMLSYELGAPEVVKEEHLHNLLKYVLIQNSKELRLLSSLPIKKTSTKEELARRLFTARDYIHAYYYKDISLDELSQVSCLSKFHFLRTFKEAFQCTPYQYIKKLRIEKAMDLIKMTKNSLEEIATDIGLENASSLSRLVYQQTHHYPSYFRN